MVMKQAMMIESESEEDEDGIFIGNCEQNAIAPMDLMECAMDAMPSNAAMPQLSAQNEMANQL